MWKQIKEESAKSIALVGVSVASSALVYAWLGWRGLVACVVGVCIGCAIAADDDEI